MKIEQPSIVAITATTTTERLRTREKLYAENTKHKQIKTFLDNIVKILYTHIMFLFLWLLF